MAENIIIKLNAIVDGMSLALHVASVPFVESCFTVELHHANRSQTIVALLVSDIYGHIDRRPGIATAETTTCP